MKIILKGIQYYFLKLFYVILIISISFYGVQVLISLIFPHYLSDIFQYLGFIGILFFTERGDKSLTDRNDVIYTLESEFNISTELANRIAKSEGHTRSHWELLSIQSQIEKVVKKENERKQLKYEIESLYLEISSRQ